jgi:hypothetical protein
VLNCHDRDVILLSVCADHDAHRRSSHRYSRIWTGQSVGVMRDWVVALHPPASSCLFGFARRRHPREALITPELLIFLILFRRNRQIPGLAAGAVRL